MEALLPVKKTRSQKAKTRRLPLHPRIPAQDLQPEGALQERLVERMAVAYWRAQRALKTEKQYALGVPSDADLSYLWRDAPKESENPTLPA
ncbi:MAG: hypothetical protein QW343_01635 [Candidatus Norongarragalinales archaeon]